MLYRFYFLFQHAHCKIEKRVGQSRPPPSKLGIMRNTSSKLKRISHKIASKLEFTNTQDNPIEIKEAEDEVSMHKKEIVFIDESKKQGSSAAFEGGLSFNDLFIIERWPFFSWLGLHWSNSSNSFTFNSSGEHFTSLFPSIYLFYFCYLCLSPVFPWSTFHLEVGAVPSLDLSFLDQPTSHVEPPSRPPTESAVVVARSTISHMLSLDLLSISIIQKDAIHETMAILKSASLDPKAKIFLYGVHTVLLRYFLPLSM